MSWHLYGNLITSIAPAANNRGENEGNITTLQKLLWNGEVHTTVSAEAIRYALRIQWQRAGLPVNRVWNDDKNDNIYKDSSFQAWQEYIDDDVLGFMSAEAAKEEVEPAAQDASEGKQKKGRAKGTTIIRRGVLEVTRAVSLLPYSGDVSFNAKSGEKKNTSLYGTEFHATRYQYGFAMTPERLHEKERLFHALDALVSLRDVAGNQSRFLYDFSPESMVLRLTQDMAPRLLFCFEEPTPGMVAFQKLIDVVKARDVLPEELFVAGTVFNLEAAQALKELGVTLYPGIKKATEALKQKLAQSLQIKQPASLMGVGA